MLSKLSKVCDVCRAKKLKCDNAPVCSYCQKHDKVCHYSVMKKPGLKPGYGGNVLKRLNALEEQNQSFLLKFEQLSDELISLKSQQIPLHPSQHPSLQPPLNTTGPASIANILNPYIPDSHSSGHILTNSTPGATLTPAANLNTSSSDMNFQERSFYPGLPPVTIVQKLVDIFFSKVFAIFPIIHPEYSRQKISKYLNQFEVNRPDNKKLPEPPVIVFSIIINALQYSTDIIFDKAERDRIIKLCKEKIILTCYSVSSIQQLQAMTLLAFYNLGNSSGIESWSLIGIAATGAIHLNLSDVKQRIPALPATHSPSSVASTSNTTSSSPIMIRTKRAKILKAPMDWVDEDSRRRLVWAIALLDMLSSFASGTPLRIPNSETEYSTPFATDVWCKSSKGNEPKMFFIGNGENVELSYDSFSYYTQLVKISRQIHSFLSQSHDINNKGEVGDWFVTFHHLENELQDWKERLPSHYQELLDNGELDIEALRKSTELATSVQLHAAFNISLIKLHSAYGYPHLQSPSFKHSKQSRKISIQCVQNIRMMASKIMRYEQEKNVNLIELFGPHYAFYIWVCARLLIADSIFKQKEGVSEPAQPLDNEFAIFRQILRSIGTYWPTSLKYYKILTMLIKLNIPLKETPNFRNDGESTDEEQIEPSQAIADMTINTHLLSTILSNKLSELDSSNGSGLPGTTTNSVSNLQEFAAKYNLNQENQQDNILLDTFQFDARSYGFEDLFGYLDQNNFSEL